MNKISEIGEKKFNKNSEEDKSKTATRFVCMPGMRPVIVPKVMPRIMARIISSILFYQLELVFDSDKFLEFHKLL